MRSWAVPICLIRNEAVTHWKIKNLDLSDLTAFLPAAKRNPLHRTEAQHHKIEGVLDHELIEQVQGSH